MIIKIPTGKITILLLIIMVPDWYHIIIQTPRGQREHIVYHPESVSLLSVINIVIHQEI